MPRANNNTVCFITVAILITVIELIITLIDQHKEAIKIQLKIFNLAQ